MEKDFDGWNIQKKRIDMYAKQKFPRPKEVWWCSLGLNVGTEEGGKDKRFSRPVLVLKVFGSGCLVVPLTTSKQKHFFRIPIGSIKNKSAAAVISQVRVIDTKRLIDKISAIDRNIFEAIKNSIKDML